MKANDLDHFGTFFDWHRPVESDTSISSEDAKLFEEVERLSVVGDKDDFITACWLDVSQETIQNGQFTGQFGLKTNQ